MRRFSSWLPAEPSRLVLLAAVVVGLFVLTVAYDRGGSL